MKVKCLHGYFIFTETVPGQVSDFISRTGLRLTPKEWYYTFEDLENAPRYSIQGKIILDSIAIKTFEGNPWEVFQENNLIYDFNKGLVVPIATIINPIKLEAAGNRFIASGLILPGSLTQLNRKVKNYSAWFSRTTYRWLYSEVEYV
jgi:hypothetical protein